MIRSITGKRLLTVMASAALMVMAPTLGRTDPPTFPTTLSLGMGCQVWDIEGIIVDFLDEPGVGTQTITFIVSTDDKGKITGTGTWVLTILDPEGDIVVSLSDPAVKGKVKSSRVGPTKLKIKSKLIGTTTGQGITIPTKGSLKASGEIDATGTLQGTFTASLKLAGQSFKETGPDSLDVTPDAANDGTWVLNLNLTSANGVNLAGTGNAVMATGYVVGNLIASGKYNATDDLSKVKLKNSTGGKVQLKNLAADSGMLLFTAGSLKYSLLGQKRLVDIATGCP